MAAVESRFNMDVQISRAVACSVWEWPNRVEQEGSLSAVAKHANIHNAC